MTRWTQPLRPHSADLLWPALPSGAAARVLSLLYQLEQTQLWPRAQLVEAAQFQLARLLEHARSRVPFYAARPSGAELGAQPLLTRREVAAEREALWCRELGAEHGGTSVVQTSGSTGQIVEVRRTDVCRDFLLALGLRAHVAHGSDFRRSLLAIRADTPHLLDEATASARGWGQPASLLYRTGPGYGLPISTSVSEQAQVIERLAPGYLLTYPTNLQALLEHFAVTGRVPRGLQAVRSMGETLTPQQRARCREVLGVPVIDVYSAQEVGIIAVECPQSGLYHVQEESLIVEVLDDAGRACEPGQTGRVVVTDLHNFAMPLIRYVIGDRAEVGPACSCGRTTATLSRIWGRERNMVTLPSGSRHWPLLGLHEYRRIAPILQYQAIQRDLTQIELRLVTAAPLSPAQEQELTEVVQRALGYAFEITLKYFAHELPRGPGGKFEEFVSELG